MNWEIVAVALVLFLSLMGFFTLLFGLGRWLARRMNLRVQVLPSQDEEGSLPGAHAVAPHAGGVQVLAWVVCGELDSTPDDHPPNWTMVTHVPRVADYLRNEMRMRVRPVCFADTLISAQPAAAQLAPRVVEALRGLLPLRAEHPRPFDKAWMNAIDALDALDEQRDKHG